MRRIEAHHLFAAWIVLLALLLTAGCADRQTVATAAGFAAYPAAQLRHRAALEPDLARCLPEEWIGRAEQPRTAEDATRDYEAGVRHVCERSDPCLPAAACAWHWERVASMWRNLRIGSGGS